MEYLHIVIMLVFTTVVIVMDDIQVHKGKMK